MFMHTTIHVTALCSVTMHIHVTALCSVTIHVHATALCSVHNAHIASAFGLAKQCCICPVIHAHCKKW